MELKANRETDRKTKTAAKYGSAVRDNPTRTALAPKTGKDSVALWSEEVQRLHCRKTSEWVLKNS